MRSVLLALVCLLVMPIMAFGDMRADAEYGVMYPAEERILTLPKDQGQWYVSLFGDPTDATYRRLKSWVRTHTGLRKLCSADQVHYNEYLTTAPQYKIRYAAKMPGLPCFRVQNSRGVVISEFYGEYIPMSAAALYAGVHSDITEKVERRCPFRRCPAPQPEPVPVPEPEIVDIPPVLEPEPAPIWPPFWMMILAMLIGGGIGGFQVYRESKKL